MELKHRANLEQAQEYVTGKDAVRRQLVPQCSAGAPLLFPPRHRGLFCCTPRVESAAAARPGPHPGPIPANTLTRARRARKQQEEDEEKAAKKAKMEEEKAWEVRRGGLGPWARGQGCCGTRTAAHLLATAAASPPLLPRLDRRAETRAWRAGTLSQKATARRKRRRRRRRRRSAATGRPSSRRRRDRNVKGGGRANQGRPAAACAGAAATAPRRPGRCESCLALVHYAALLFSCWPRLGLARAQSYDRHRGKTRL